MERKKAARGVDTVKLTETWLGKWSEYSYDFTKEVNNHSPSLYFCSDMTSLMDLSDKIPALWNTYEAPRSISNLNSKKDGLQP